MFLAVLTLITALSISAVNINKLDIVTISVNENTIQINITYSIPNTGVNDTLELNFR